MQFFRFRLRRFVFLLSCSTFASIPYECVKFLTFYRTIFAYPLKPLASVWTLITGLGVQYTKWVNGKCVIFNLLALHASPHAPILPKLLAQRTSIVRYSLDKWIGLTDCTDSADNNSLVYFVRKNDWCPKEEKWKMRLTLVSAMLF